MGRRSGPAPLLMLESVMLDGADGMESAPPTKQKRKAWLYPDLPWGVPFEFESTQASAERRLGRYFLKAWEITTAIACIYIGFVIPFTLGFEKLYIGGEQCLYAARPEGQKLPDFFEVVRVLDVVVDLIFWIDILITFVTARWVIQTAPIYTWILIEDLARFLLSIKLLRLHRLHSVIEALHKHWPDSKYLTTIAEIIVYFFLIAHWSACFFFGISFGLADPTAAEGTWERYLFDEGWVKQSLFMEMEPRDFLTREEGIFIETPWLTSFYWAVTTMSTIGYGDISPQTDPERIVGIVLMITGCGFFAGLTGKITALLTGQSVPEARFSHTMDELEMFMQTRNLPIELCQKLRDFYKIKYPRKCIFDEEALLKSLDSDGLRKEISLNMYLDMLSSVPFFQMCNIESRRDICHRLKIKSTASSKVITVAGEYPDALYMIRHGEVEVKGRQSIKVILGRGQIFGEMALMGLTPDGRRLRTASGVTHCEFCVLLREDFEQLLSSDTGVCQVVRQTVMSHMKLLKTAARAASTNEGSLRDALAFYERLCFVDWHQTLDEMIIRKKNAKAHIKKAQFPEAKIKVLEEASQRKAIRSLVKLQLGSLTSDDPAFFKCVDTSHLCKIVVSWDDPVHGMSSENESEEFSFIRESPDVIGVRRNVDIPILHVDKLKHLASVSIRLSVQPEENSTPAYQRWTPGMRRSETFNMHQQDQLFDQDEKSSTTNLLNRVKAELGFSPQKAGRKGEGAAKRALPNQLWQGRIEMQDIVKHRTRGSAKNTLFQVSLSSRANPSCELIASCTVRRICVLPIWGRILTRIRNRGLLNQQNSRQQRISLLCNAVQSTSHSFLEELAEKTASLLAEGGKIGLPSRDSMERTTNNSAGTARAWNQLSGPQDTQHGEQSHTPPPHQQNGLDSNLGAPTSLRRADIHPFGARTTVPCCEGLSAQALGKAIESGDDAAVKEACAQMALGQARLTQELQTQILEQQYLIQILLQRGGGMRDRSGDAQGADHGADTSSQESPGAATLDNSRESRNRPLLEPTNRAKDREDGRRHASEHRNGFDGSLGEWASKHPHLTNGNGLRSNVSELPGAGISSQDDAVRSKRIDLFSSFSQVMSDH